MLDRAMPGEPKHTSPSAEVDSQSTAPEADDKQTSMDVAFVTDDHPSHGGHQSKSACFAPRDDVPIRFVRRPQSVHKSRARLILPIGVAGVIVAIIVGSLLQREEPHTVTEVAQQISEIVLRTSDRPGVDDGGPLGPLWIAAREIDMQTAKLTDVRVRAGQVRLAAREGQLIIDPKANTISFTLKNVVLVKVPERGEDADASQTMMDMDTFIIGPVPYKRRIIADGHPAAEGSIPRHLAGVQTE
jgi:hypothetical protein